jgi:hypothetical protein
MRTLLLVAGGVLASSVLAAQAVTQDVPILDPQWAKEAQAVVELAPIGELRSTDRSQPPHEVAAAVEG